MHNLKRKITIMLIILLLILILHPVVISEIDWWPQFHHDARNTGFTTSLGPDMNTFRWESSVSGKALSSPAVVDGKVYIGIEDDLYCYNATDGNFIWSYPTGDNIRSSPDVANGRVYVGSDDHNIYCLNAENGSKLWNYTTDDKIYHSSPNVVDDKVYIGSSDNNIYCLDAETGQKIWNYTTEGIIYACPAVADGKVYIGSGDGNIYCLDAEGNGDGTTDKIWNFTTGSGIVSSPAVVDGKVYVADYTGNTMWCLDAETGNYSWSFVHENTIICSPAVVNNRVYFGSTDDKMFCLNATDGSIHWSQDLPDGVYDSSPAVTENNKVYIGTWLEGIVLCLDANTGNIIWSYDIEFSGGIHSSPAVAQGKVYIGTSENGLFCLGNSVPETPNQPDGPTEGEVGVEYTYTTDEVDDPNNDDVEYLFNWGDGTNSGWISSPSFGHVWSEPDTYEVKAKAKDIYGAEGDWSPILYVTITSGENIPKLIITAPSSVIEGESFDVNVTSDNDPIENVDVEFNDETKATNSDGQVTFTAPEVSEPTPYTITATLEGYTGDTETITVLNQIEKKGWIYGVVYSESSPLENVKITITSGNEKRVKYTDAKGSYVQSVSPGTYTVEASKQGYTTIIEEDVNVTDGKAIGLDFVLEKKPESSTGKSDRNVGFIEYTIQREVLAKKISARLDVVGGGKTETTYYSDELMIETNSTKEIISFTVAAENGTNGTILVIRIGEGVLEDLDNLNITYDGVQIDEFVSIEEFFDIQGNTTPGWLGFSTKAGLYIFVRVPKFSTHTIAIYSILDEFYIFGEATPIIFYITMFIVVAIIVIVPILYIDRKEK